MIKTKEDVRVSINVVVRAYDENGTMVARRRGHNVFTNTGKNWLVRAMGAANYGVVPPTPHTSEKIMYMGYGCGGALQTNPAFVTGQAELVTVNALQDPVPVSDAGGGQFVYLKQVDNQSLGSSVYFPGDYRTVFVSDISGTEISFSGSTTRVSNVNVGTQVPVSEAGLYLSDASPFFSPAAPLGYEADPAGANSMGAYFIFSPIIVTTGVALRSEWELRVG